MSDAQAATVTENGVPPAAQEYVIEEAPAFKVRISFPRKSPAHHHLGLRWQSCVLYDGWRAGGFLCPREERHVRSPSLLFLHSLLRFVVPR